MDSRTIPTGRRSRAASRSALAAAALTCALAGDAHAQDRDFEIGPWLGWEGGVEWQGGRQRDVFYLNAGLDVTVSPTTFGSAGYGGAFELRTGPWLAFHAPTDRKASGEGGLTMIVTQTNHAQWGTFGLRVGTGYGGDFEAHIVATAWGGVRYVPARAGEGSSGGFPKATGLRVVATYRHTIDPIERTALVFGIELEPDYFLPPYSLFKWGGKH